MFFKFSDVLLDTNFHLQGRWEDPNRLQHGQVTSRNGNAWNANFCDVLHDVLHLHTMYIRLVDLASFFALISSLFCWVSLFAPCASTVTDIADCRCPGMTTRIQTFSTIIWPCLALCSDSAVNPAVGYPASGLFSYCASKLLSSFRRTLLCQESTLFQPKADWKDAGLD